MITTHSRFHTSFRNNLGKLYNIYICDREFNNYEIQDGYRYNWWAASDARHITPAGWEIPVFQILSDICSALTLDPSIINTNQLGYRLDDGSFAELNTSMILWSKTEHTSIPESGYIGSLELPSGYETAYYDKNYGFCLRAIKSNTSLAEGETGAMTGNDGKIYTTKCIDVAGTLIEITTENLCETLFRNGESIPELITDVAWLGASGAGRCSFDNDETNAITIGNNDSIAYVAGKDGFVLNYESDDILCPSIVSSRCEVQILLNDTIRADWETFIQDLLQSDNETRFFIYITENSEPYWVGPIQVERLRVPDEFYTRVSLTATDGFGLLGSIPYDNAGTLYTGWDTIAQHVTNVLTKLHMHDEMPWSMMAHASNWNLSEYVNPIRGVRFNHDAMKEFKGEATLPFDCLTVLKQILQRFNLRLVQQNTVYFLENYYTLSLTDAVDVDYFDNTGTYLETDTIPLNYSTVDRLRGGMLFYREQAKYASVQYGYKDAIQGSNMFGIFPIDENEPFEMGIIPAGNGETVGFSFDFRLYISGAATFYVEFIFTIQCGTYYLSKAVNSSSMAWVDGATTARVRFNSLWPFAYQANSIEPLGFIIPEAPETAEMIFTWTWRITDYISGEEIIPGGGAICLLTRNISTIIYGVGEANEGTIVTTASGGSISGEIVEPDILIIGDLPYLRSVGRLQFYGVAEEWLNTDHQWGYNVDTYTIDELLALELAAFQRTPTKVLTYKLRSDIYFAYKLDGKILLRGSYNANMNHWDVECFEPDFSLTGLVLSTYVETESTGGIPGGLITPPTPVITGASNWTRTGTTLTPKITGDKVQVAVTGSDVAITATAVNTNAGSFTSTNGSGLYGESTNSSGGYFKSYSVYTLFLQRDSSTTNSTISVLRLLRSTSGTAANNIGSAIEFVLENSAGLVSAVSAQITALLTNATSGSETSVFTWWLRNAGAALAEVMRLTGAGELLNLKQHVGSGTTAPNSTHQITGSQSRSMLIVTGDTTLNDTHYTVLCDTTSADVDIALPAASGRTGRCYRIRRWSGTNDVTITPSGYNSIIGSVSSYALLTLTNNGEWVEIMSNGSDWYIVQDNPTF